MTVWFSLLPRAFCSYWTRARALNYCVCSTSSTASFFIYTFFHHDILFQRKRPFSPMLITSKFVKLKTVETQSRIQCHALIAFSSVWPGHRAHRDHSHWRRCAMCSPTHYNGSHSTEARTARPLSTQTVLLRYQPRGALKGSGIQRRMYKKLTGRFTKHPRRLLCIALQTCFGFWFGHMQQWRLLLCFVDEQQPCRVCQRHLPWFSCDSVLCIKRLVRGILLLIRPLPWIQDRSVTKTAFVFFINAETGVFEIPIFATTNFPSYIHITNPIGGCSSKTLKTAATE